jgi:hypothetical protein
MKWKFWAKEEDGSAPKLPKPREMPQQIGQHLVTRLNQNPDHIWNYKALLMPREGSKTAFAVRIYNPVAAYDRGIRVVNYTSLDEAPDLILFQGWYDQGSGKMEIAQPAAPLRAA